ncbi:glycosyltransferase family 4 protein [Robertkochia flava]|uniref:glycosyltransferase family 4 protein n=1 Tax=Robertkochia flava TaxID=3447986 RepID=UPI001CCAB970|nr:glycosyltransferase family 4 protein [Robertkochia marina]
MNCLHLCNDLLGSKVHLNLYHQLHRIGLQQSIFFASRREHKGLNEVKSKNPDLKILTNKVPINKFHRIFFRSKIEFLYGHLIQQISPKDYDIIHATTLFSDGALAFKLNQEYGIPYVVAIRATDIDLFMKYRFDLFPLCLQIIRNAKKIIFIAESLHIKLKMKSFYTFLKSQLDQKSVAIYNGIDEQWLQNRNFENTLNNPIKVLFVGNLVYRKHPLELINAVKILHQSGLKINLTLVGKKGDQLTQILQEINKYPGLICYRGEIKSLCEMKAVYRCHDIFALPSEGETFGLVYLEALSQGLPILLCANQGIDGIIDNFPGVRIAKPTPLNISQGLERIILDYPTYDFCSLDMDEFYWSNVAKKYKALFEANTKQEINQ